MIKFALPTKSPENLVVKSFVFKQKNTKWCCFFNRIIFNYQFIEYRHYEAPWTYVLLLGLFFTMYTKYESAFAFFREDWKLWNYNMLSFGVRGILKILSNICDRAFCWKPLSFFKKRFIIDIWVRKKPLIVSIYCNMYHSVKVTSKIY